jgi:glycosyltransferase involved in cell wall biosynthesis
VSTHIAVISGDLLPVPGLPTTGAGLRAWGLGKGLESRGLRVSYLMPGAALMKVQSAQRDKVRTIENLHLFTFENVNQVLGQLSPDVLVVQHWPTAWSIDTTFRPTALDLHGPILLETMYQENPNYDTLKRMKIEAFNKCDFFICPAERQKYYFYPWMLLGGCDLRSTGIEVIPISLSPDIPPFEKPEEIRFIYGGVLLPWHNPTVGLEALVKTIEARGKGTLSIYCGKHPYVNIPPGKLQQLLDHLGSSQRVFQHGMLPREEVLDVYRHASVAFDAMERNPERELAFTTRTVEYMWCGLPVVYQDYSVLAPFIERYGAGWLVNPDDEDQIKQVIEHILSHPEEIDERGRNAQRLVRQEFTWDRTIGPLASFCEKPFKLQKSPDLIGRLRGEFDHVREAKSRVKHDVRQALYYLSEGTVKELVLAIRRRLKLGRG